MSICDENRLNLYEKLQLNYLNFLCNKIWLINVSSYAKERSKFKIYA